MATMIIEGKHLASALLAASDEDVRFYLNGVYVEASDTVTRVCATNGHIMYVADESSTARDGEALNAFTGSMQGNGLIIPRDIVERLKPKAKNRYVLEVGDKLHKDSRSYACTIREWSETTITSFNSIDGLFPQYNRVMPHFAPAQDWTFNPDTQTLTRLNIGTLPPHAMTIDGDKFDGKEMCEALNRRQVAAQFDLSYMVVAHKISVIHGTSKAPLKPTLYQNGYQPSVFRWDDNTYMVIMPMRDDRHDTFPVLDQFRSRIAVEEKESLSEEQKEEN